MKVACMVSNNTKVLTCEGVCFKIFELDSAPSRGHNALNPSSQACLISVGQLLMSSAIFVKHFHKVQRRSFDMVATISTKLESTTNNLCQDVTL